MVFLTPVPLLGCTLDRKEMWLFRFYGRWKKSNTAGVVGMDEVFH